MKHLPTQLLVWLLAVLMVWPWPVRLNAQSNGTTFKPEEIEQLVAPIALYPDSVGSAGPDGVHVSPGGCAG